MEDGNLEQAAQQVMAHLRLHQNEPRGLAQLGTIAMQLGALGQAENFLRLAISNGGNNLETRRNLASILNQQERLEEAQAMFEALRSESSEPNLTSILALILEKLGQNEAAAKLHDWLVQNHGNNPFYWIFHGHSRRAAGRVDEAIEAYRTAIERDFECGEAWWGLASIKQRIFTDEDVEKMQEAARIAIDIRNTAPLQFALARACHDREDYEAAFAHYTEGNRQRAENIGYDARELTDEISEIEKSVDANYVARLHREPAGSDVPIFIVSLPRSGSTLLEQMLGSHRDIEPIGELPYIPAILRSAMEMATRKGKVTVPQLIASISPQQADAMGEDYLRRAKLHRKTDRPYFIDKLPHNWSNILFIKRILPQARIIDIRRPAMDCCFSNFTQSFSSAHASSFALKDIGQCYSDYVRLMDHLAKVAPAMVNHVNYERLIEDAQSELKPTFDYLGLPWDPAVLDFHKLKRVVRTPSSEQVRRPLNRDGMNAWKPYEQWLQPLRDALGAHAGP